MSTRHARDKSDEPVKDIHHLTSYGFEENHQSVDFLNIVDGTALIVMEGEFSDMNTDPVYHQLMAASVNKYVKDILITVSSYGGVVTTLTKIGTAIFQCWKANKPVDTFVISAGYSCGAILAFMATRLVILGHGAFIMKHDPRSQFRGEMTARVAEQLAQEWSMFTHELFHLADTFTIPRRAWVRNPTGSGTPAAIAARNVVIKARGNADFKNALDEGFADGEDTFSTHASLHKLHCDMTEGDAHRSGQFEHFKGEQWISTASHEAQVKARGRHAIVTQEQAHEFIQHQYGKFFTRSTELRKQVVREFIPRDDDLEFASASVSASKRELKKQKQRQRRRDAKAKAKAEAKATEVTDTLAVSPRSKTPDSEPF